MTDTAAKDFGGLIPARVALNSSLVYERALSKKAEMRSVPEHNCELNCRGRRGAWMDATHASRLDEDGDPKPRLSKLKTHKPDRPDV